MNDINPVDHTSTVGRIRKYIPDMVLLEDPKNPLADPSYYFSDIEIAGFGFEYEEDGVMGRSAVKRAAADAIDALANNEALVLKKITTEDLETDGAAVANALRLGAQALRNQAKADDLAENAFVAIVPFKKQTPNYGPGWR